MSGDDEENMAGRGGEERRGRRKWIERGNKSDFGKETRAIGKAVVVKDRQAGNVSITAAASS